MSFSSQSKNEVARIHTEGKCCNRAQLAGIVRVSSSLELVGFKQINLRITTENAAVARWIFSFTKKLYQLSGSLSMKENKTLHRHHSYDIFIEKANDILVNLGIIGPEGNIFEIVSEMPDFIFQKECCKRAYLRGVYLGSGSLSDPGKSYHFEIVCHDETYAGNLVVFLNSFYDLSSKYTMRKQNFIVYIKESEKIVDFLNIIGAHQTLLEFENIRIIKQMRNNVNRVVNCETANLNKTIDAAYDQIQAIEYLEKSLGLHSIPEKLREVAEKRLDNPDATLLELGEMLNPPIGKSGVNHRLKKIIQLAEKMKEKGE